MTYNVHSLLHLARSVYHSGPLWAHNAFSFESGNGGLLKVIHAAKGIHDQICRRISLKYSMLFLKEVLQPHCSHTVKHFYNHLGTTLVRKSLQISEIRYFGTASHVDRIWIEKLHLSEQAVTYKKIVKKSCLYVSSMKDNKRSNNSFAQLGNGSYMQLVDFIVDPCTKNEYTVVKKISTTDSFNKNCNMIRKIVKIDNETFVIFTSEIYKVCVHMLLGKDSEYLCAVPNLYYY